MTNLPDDPEGQEWRRLRAALDGNAVAEAGNPPEDSAADRIIVTTTVVIKAEPEPDIPLERTFLERWHLRWHRWSDTIVTWIGWNLGGIIALVIIFLLIPVGYWNSVNLNNNTGSILSLVAFVLASATALGFTIGFMVNRSNLVRDNERRLEREDRDLSDALRYWARQYEALQKWYADHPQIGMTKKHRLRAEALLKGMRFYVLLLDWGARPPETVDLLVRLKRLPQSLRRDHRSSPMYRRDTPPPQS